jgi:hypothetical protein
MKAAHPAWFLSLRPLQVVSTSGSRRGWMSNLDVSGVGLLSYPLAVYEPASREELLEPLDGKFTVKTINRINGE